MPSCIVHGPVAAAVFAYLHRRTQGLSAPGLSVCLCTTHPQAPLWYQLRPSFSLRRICTWWTWHQPSGVRLRWLAACSTGYCASRAVRRLSRRVSSVSRKVTCTWRPAIMTWQLALAGASGKGWVSAAADCAGAVEDVGAACTACMARRWMPAAMRCLHHEDGALGKSGQSHVPLTSRDTRRALTLAGDPGMPVCEQLDIALQDDRHGFVDAAVALGQGGFGLSAATWSTAARKACRGGVLEVWGRCLFPTDLMYCYHCCDLPIICGTVVVSDHGGASHTSVVNLYAARSQGTRSPSDAS